MSRKTSTNEEQIDAAESDYLYLKTSQIPNAGKGLFTAIDINKGEIISVFKGEILSDRQIDIRVKNNKDRYFIQMLDGTIMDSMNVKCFAKYANDAKGSLDSSLKNNSRIAVSDDDEVCIIATRNIKEGEEIFCGYGKGYWNKHGLN
ncbi:MAG: SET domain-containing protein [Bacteroidota bacterium]